MLPSRALGVLVSTCGARLLHRGGSSVSCQTSSAQHHVDAKCPASQRMRRSAWQRCDSAYRMPIKQPACILQEVPAFWTMSRVPDHCERCHKLAGRVWKISSLR